MWGGGVEGQNSMSTTAFVCKHHCSLFSCDCGAVVASRERVAGRAVDLR